MPDLFTHFTSGFIFIKFGLRKKRFVMFLVGCSFPDLLTRIPVILADLIFSSSIDSYVIPMHTPIGILLSIYIVTFMFETNLRRDAFVFLSLGSALHLGLDVLQTQFFRSDYFLFFPFSFYAPEINLFHYDKSIEWFLPELILVMLLSFQFLRKNKVDV